MTIGSKKFVLFLMGPTASGKTELAIEISKTIDSKLISVDSALIYKGMDIGTAKPDKKTLKEGLTIMEHAIAKIDRDGQNVGNSPAWPTGDAGF